jgi:hypothetical protein
LRSPLVPYLNEKPELFIQRQIDVGTPRNNGFLKCFNRTLLDEFFRSAFVKKLHEIVDSLQEDLNQWLNHYNYERPHRGYRNMGRRPVEAIKLAKNVVRGL